MPTPPDSSLRREVQALRAIAAMMVVLYHLWPGRFTGGYAGVDVFFVISGFLITGHLVRDAERSGRISLPRFWARRARRLLPAAYLVIAVSTGLVFLLLPQMQWRQSFHELIAASLYFENWQLAHDAVDYLAAANPPSAVQHYWTLSVEEQFYLAWPVLVLIVLTLARQRVRRTLARTVAAVTLASFCYSVWLTQTNPSWAYFVTPGRVWEFGLGALLALALGRSDETASPRHARSRGVLRPLASWLGLFGLAVATFGYDDATSFPGVAALLPTMATVLVIAAGMPGGVLSPAPLLRPRPVQWLGDVSYSVYLWHWPLLVLLPAASGRVPGLAERVGVLAATLVLAWLTTRFVEDPIRHHHRTRHAPPRWVLATAGVVALALVAPSAVGARISTAAAERAAQAAHDLVASNPPCFGAASMDQATPCHNPDLDHLLVPAPAVVATAAKAIPGCFNNYEDVDLLDCHFGDGTDDRLPRVLLLGDSHAGMFLNTLVALARKGALTMSAQLKAACPWSDPPPSRPTSSYPEECAEFRSKLNAWLRTHAREFDLVLTNARMDNLPGTIRQRRRDFAAAWNIVGRQGVPVVGIVDNPRWAVDPNVCLAKLAPEEINPDACGRPRSTMPKVQDPTAGAAALTENGHVLDLTDLYCHDGWCPAIAGGVNMYRDPSHLSQMYADTLGPYLYQRLVDRGLLDVAR